MIVACLQEALRHHQAGRLAEAEGLYRRVLAADPLQADAAASLGNGGAARGDDWTRPTELVSRAVELKPAEAIFVSNLGVVLEALGRFAEAEAAYRRALELNPRHAESLNNLGNLHRARLADRRGARMLPGGPRAKARLRDGPRQPGHHVRRPAEIRRGDRLLSPGDLALDARFVDARKNLAIALADQGHLNEAAEEMNAGPASAPAR